MSAHGESKSESRKPKPETNPKPEIRYAGHERVFWETGLGAFVETLGIRQRWRQRLR